MAVETGRAPALGEEAGSAENVPDERHIHGGTTYQEMGSQSAP